MGDLKLLNSLRVFRKKGTEAQAGRHMDDLRWDLGFDAKVHDFGKIIGFPCVLIPSVER